MSQLRRLLPSLNALVTFEAAVRCGTFARAAEELGVTGPAVSRTIARLEQHLGVSLFQRTPTGATLNQDGKLLFDGLSDSFDSIERAVLRVRKPGKAAPQQIVLSISTAFATHWLMPRLDQFRAAFPGVEPRFDLVTGPLNVPADGADIAMRFDHGSDIRHLARPLMPELLIPIAAPDFKREGAKADTLLPRADRIINLSKTEPDWSGLFAERHPERANSALQFSDYAVVVQAALAGQGVALGWLSVVSSLLAQGQLVPADMTVIATGRICELVTNRNARSPAIARVCDWMQAEFRADAAAIDARYPDLGLAAMWK